MNPKNIISIAKTHGLRMGLSPWLLVGLAVILGLVITVLSVKSTQQDRDYMTQNMIDRGEALIWALEAGTRTWAGMHAGQPQPLQPLVEETAKQPGIVFIAVLDAQGTILAHSKQSRIGTTVSPQSQTEPPTSTNPDGQFGEFEGKKVFEVYRSFVPFRKNFHASDHRGLRPCGNRHSNWHRAQRYEPDKPSSDTKAVSSGTSGIVIVGLDAQPFEMALNEEFRDNVLAAILVAALGFAGVVSLFWAHNYQRFRKQLKDSRAMAAEVVSNLPLGLLTCDPEGNLSMINPPAKNMLNIAANKENALQLQDIPGLDWTGIRAELAEKGRILDRELVLSGTHARHVPVSMSAATMRNEDGVLLGALFILRDISEMKRLQSEARRNERLTALGNLAAGVAHEIRNPLSTIKGMATYIARRMNPGGREEEAANTMIIEVDRLNRVVSELLEFARPGPVTKVSCNVRDVVDLALRLGEADLKSKNITTRVNEEPDFPRVFVSPERFAQALLNLILNAVQAMDPGGTLTISLEQVPGNAFSVSVSDTGPGIPEDIQASIFTPYFTTKPSGTGLGLAIVHQIVEGHGGRIQVSAVPGSGARFTLILPMNDQEQESL